MRNFSTPRSAFEGEITKLAVLECFLSIAIYAGIGFYWHTFAHYVWAIAVAPLMLFRTDDASFWALNVLRGFPKFGTSRSLFLSSLFFMSIPIRAVLVRILGTLYWLLRHPVYTLSAMPGNWVRQALCTDLLHPPELLPLESLTFPFTGLPAFSTTVIMMRVAYRDRKKEKFRWFVLAQAMFFPLILLGYVPSLLYRVSFKATSLVYAPFVFVAHTSLHSTLSVKTRLERFTKGELEKVRRAFSVLVLAIAALKLSIAVGWFDLSQLMAKIPSQKLVNSFIQPTRVPWWQCTLVLDALLTWIIFWIADASLARLDEKAWPEKLVLGTIAGATLVRNVFSIVWISCIFVLTLQEIDFSKLGKLLTS